METIKKTYTIEEIRTPDGKITLNRKNDGFNAIELMGVLTFTQSEIIDQMHNRYQPDVVTRVVYKYDHKEDKNPIRDSNETN